MLLLGLFNTAVIAGPINCGAKPISLSFFDFGLFYFTKNGQDEGISKDVIDELIKLTFRSTFRNKFVDRCYPCN
jgi:hypothetical protein